MNSCPTRPLAPSIRSYTEARDAEQKDALKTQAPRALTDLLASAMTTLAGSEASNWMSARRSNAEKKES